MAFEKITDTDLVDKGISGLPDVPGLTTSAMQAKFDELAKDVIIPKLNAIVDGLNGTEVGNSSKVTDPTDQKEKNIQNTIDAIYAIVAANAEAKHTHSNKTDLDKITSTFLDAVSSLIQMLSGISSVATAVTDDDTKIPTAGAIVDYVVKLGAGDMTKAVYDKDNDGVVDDASKLGGEAPSSYLKVAELSDASVEFSEASTRENIQTGEDVKTVFSKIAKWFADMTAAAFAQTITSYEDLMANTVSGYLADALAVKSGFETINSNLNVRYNPDTDMVQIYYNGEWYDVINAGAQSLQLVNTLSEDWVIEKTAGVNSATLTVSDGVITINVSENSNNYAYPATTYYKYKNKINPVGKTLYFTFNAGGTIVDYFYTTVVYSKDGKTWTEIAGSVGASCNQSVQLTVEEPVYLAIKTHANWTGNVSHVVNITDFRIE